MTEDSAAFTGYVLFMVWAFLYFVPTMVAVLRAHPRKAQVVVINLFFGWSGIGWVVALVIAVGPIASAPRKGATRNYRRIEIR